MPLNLRADAARFCDELSQLLNNTICHGIRINAVVASTQPVRMNVGYRIRSNDVETTQGVPVTLGRKSPTGFLALAYRLSPDEAGRYMMVVSSFLGYYLDPELKSPLMHYDYEREKEGYPEAHMQITATAEAWDQICQRNGWSKPLEKLHFPVGGRRYRPIAEDLIDFLVAEEIAEARRGWQAWVDQGRERFYKTQLRAAIRRDPDTARLTLTEIEGEQGLAD
jgi:hypothetical protein